jgi:uncharacterized radical SAM superfamily Fe-S cluster-containing enzyme
MKIENPSTYLHSTLAYCPECGKGEQAGIFVRDNKVFLERLCPQLGTPSIKIANDYKWYLERMGEPRKILKIKNPKPVQNSCPFDCGPCVAHAGGIHLPVVSITNDCNLNCPICFTYNRPDKKYYKSPSDMKRIIEHLLDRTESIELVNITGGEPTLHPELFKILEVCQNDRIARITMNTNGVRIARDPALAQRIKDMGVQLVFSLDTLDPEKSSIIHGRDVTGLKRRALEIIEDLAIPTTILPVCIKGVNEEDVAGIVHDYIKKDFVRSFTIQNMTYTGRNGSSFQPREHITIDEVENLLSHKGVFSSDDFFSLGSYHPLCYSVAYYVVHEDRILSLSRLIDKKLLSSFTVDSYVLNPERDLSTHFREGINRLWAEGSDPDFLKVLRDFLDELYPAERILSRKEIRDLAESMVKMIYIHPHMDEDNFDLHRACLCGDMVPDESGNMIPACSYNLVHRRNDPRFWIEGM